MLCAQPLAAQEPDGIRPADPDAPAALLQELPAEVANVEEEPSPSPNDSPAGDVVSWATVPRGDIELPAPPDDFTTETIGEVEWSYPSGASDDVQPLQALFVDSWSQLETDFGVPVDSTMVIRIARDPDEMRALAPVGSPPPAYASGVAYTHIGLVILTLTAPETWVRPDLDRVFVHELSHIALRRAVNAHPLPRWFVEGVAIHQSGEMTFERMKTLWSGHMSERLIPLDQLDRSFPAESLEVSMAYAQSADVVAFLRRDSSDARRFRTLIEELGEGDTFDEALSQAYALTAGQLERDWREALAGHVHTLPLLVGSGTFWALGGFLVVLAYWRRRRRHRRRVAEMGAEEAVEEAALARAEALVDAQLAKQEQRVVLLVSGEPPQGREPGVPTVRHEGGNHTLH